jgi:hypothetical protein
VVFDPAVLRRLYGIFGVIGMMLMDHRAGNFSERP